MKNPLKSVKNLKSKFIKSRKSESSIDLKSGGSSTNSEPETSNPESSIAKETKEETDATSLTQSQPITSNEEEEEEDQILTKNTFNEDEVVIVEEGEITNGHTTKENETEEKKSGIKFPKVSMKKIIKTDILEKGKESLSKVKDMTEKVATTMTFKKIEEEKEEEVVKLEKEEIKNETSNFN